MRTRTTYSNGERGSTVLMVLVLVGIVGISLVAYLSMIGQRARAVSRSQSWNLCVPAAESGLEEAMAHLNYRKGKNLANHGWTALAGSKYIKTVDTGSGRYSVQISNISPPVVETRGSVESQGILNVAATSGQITRSFRITTRFRPEVRGIMAQTKVTVQGTAKADSYNSAVGPYNPANPGDNSFIGNNSMMAQQLEVKDGAKIHGEVGTGAPGGLKLSSPSIIGDTPYVNNPANAGQVEAGHNSSGLNVPISTVPATPFSGPGLPPGGGSVGGTNYSYVLSGNNYKVNGTLTLDSSKVMMVTGNATLWVTDTLVVKDTSKIIIAPDATLTLYLEKQFYAQGNSQINPGGRAEQFSYYGMNSNAEFYMSDFATLVGTVYSPAAKMDISGNAQLFGGGHANEIVLQGNSRFHYDEALSATREQPFVITSWKEL